MAWRKKHHRQTEWKLWKLLVDRETVSTVHWLWCDWIPTYRSRQYLWTMWMNDRERKKASFVQESLCSFLTATITMVDIDSQCRRLHPFSKLAPHHIGGSTASPNEIATENSNSAPLFRIPFVRAVQLLSNTIWNQSTERVFDKHAYSLARNETERFWGYFD